MNWTTKRRKPPPRPSLPEKPETWLTLLLCSILLCGTLDILSMRYSSVAGSTKPAALSPFLTIFVPPSERQSLILKYVENRGESQTRRRLCGVPFRQNCKTAFISEQATTPTPTALFLFAILKRSSSLRGNRCGICGCREACLLLTPSIEYSRGVRRTCARKKQVAWAKSWKIVEARRAHGLQAGN